MNNYIRLIYYKEDTLPYIKLKLFLEWIGFRIYECRLDLIKNREEFNNPVWIKEFTILLYSSQMENFFQMESTHEKNLKIPFIILSPKKEKILEDINTVIYYDINKEIPYASILEKICPQSIDNGIQYIILQYQIDLIRSMYTIIHLYNNSKLKYKKSELLEDAEKNISRTIQNLEIFAKKYLPNLKDNLHFHYAINYLKDLQNVKRKLFQEELAWSSQEIVDSLNELLERENNFKSCYSLKASVCEKQLVLDISELPMVNLLNGVDRLDYVTQYKLGVFYQNNRLEEEKALDQYKKCLKINPYYNRNLYKLALYYKSKKKYDLALEYFSKILNGIEKREKKYWETEEFEYYFKVQFFVAQIYWNTEEYYKANLAYQKAFLIWSYLEECNVVKELYNGKEYQIKLFMQNKYQLEEKRQNIVNEIGLPLKVIKW